MNQHPDVDALLRSALIREAEHAMTLTDTPAAHQRLLTRLSRDTRGRRIRIAALTTAAAVAAVAVGAALLGGGDGPRRVQPVIPASPGPVSAPPEVTVDAAVALPATAVAVRGSVRAAPLRQNLAAAGGSLWSVAASGRAVVRIDPRTGRQQGTVALQPPAGMVAEAVAGAGNRLVVTAAPAGHVVEGEPKTNAAYLVVDAGRGVQTASIPTLLDFGQDGNRVSTGPAGTWVQSGPQELGLLDAAAGSITRRLPVGAALNGFAVGATELWVASYDAGTTTRVDVATGQTATIETGSSTINAAALGEAGFVWRSGQVLRLAGTPPVVAATLALPFANGGKADFTFVADRLYCVCGVAGELTSAAPTLESARTFTVPGSSADTSIAALGGRLWLLLPDGTLLAMDPQRL